MPLLMPRLARTLDRLDPGLTLFILIAGALVVSLGRAPWLPLRVAFAEFLDWIASR